MLEQVITDSGSCEDLRPKTAIVHPNIRRTSSYKETPTYLQKNSGNKTQHEHYPVIRRHTPASPRCQLDKKISSKFQPSVDYRINVKENGHQDSGYVDRSSSQSSSAAWARHSFSDNIDSGSDSDDLDEVPLFRSKMPGKEKDKILSQYIKLGSRIVVSVPQKPPKYGRKISKSFFLIIT